MNGLASLALVVAACALDRLVGDPRRCPHPVQVMGWAIDALRRAAEAWAGDDPLRLRLAGGVLTLLVVGGSAGAGWELERLALSRPALGLPLLVIAMASALAGRSLEQAVRQVLAELPQEADGDLEPARRRLAWIVGRDVEGLAEAEILRAAAETAAENAVDGLFAPLFWLLVGAALWVDAPAGPGPLTLAWSFKAASTLDSMLGYRRGRLRWLGTAGARLDDALTWLPCRLVAATLALAAGRPERLWSCWREALRQGAPDPSPNAGVSQAAFALVAGVRLGGVNHYGGQERAKPVLAAAAPVADRTAVERILWLSTRLEALWLAGAALLLALAWVLRPPGVAPTG